jgi:hypothetical protein
VEEVGFELHAGERRRVHLRHAKSTKRFFPAAFALYMATSALRRRSLAPWLTAPEIATPMLALGIPEAVRVAAEAAPGGSEGHRYG